MHPKPLVRVLANICLSDSSVLGCIRDGVAFSVSGIDQWNLRPEVENVLLLAFLPKKETRNDCGSGFKGDAGESGRSGGEASEERDKNALGRRHVCIHENPDGLAISHRRDQAARKVIFMDDAISVQAANLIDEVVYEGIVEAANDHAHWITHERVMKAGELPSAKMAGKNQDTFAAITCGKVMVQALIADKSSSGIWSVGRHQAELRQLVTESEVSATEKVGPVYLTQFRERKFNVALT